MSARRKAWLKSHRSKMRAAGICRECRCATDCGMVRCVTCKRRLTQTSRGEIMMVDKTDLIRRGLGTKGPTMMAFNGAVYECKVCGEVIVIDAERAYETRDDAAAEGHTCKAG